MDDDPVELGRQIVRACLGLGFAAAGIAAARPSDRAEEFESWLRAGKHGSMKWMEEYAAQRLDIAKLLPGARAVIIVADQYAPRGDLDPSPAPSEGRIARYARGRDYHAAMRKRLHRLSDELRRRFRGRGESFRTFVDTAPVMEREHAARAGLGWIAKNTLLIHPRLGSYLVLGGVATTLEIRPEASALVTDHCGACVRCIESCPTGAITPYSVDATRCLSYLTIEHEGPIANEFRAPMGDRVLGCDVCQEVCPHNSPVEQPECRVNAAFGGAVAADRAMLNVEEILAWSAADRQKLLTASAIKRASLAMLKRNAAIVAANALARSPDGRLTAALTATAADESEPPDVRAAANDALAT